MDYNLQKGLLCIIIIILFYTHYIIIEICTLFKGSMLYFAAILHTKSENQPFKIKIKLSSIKKRIKISVNFFFYFQQILVLTVFYKNMNDFQTDSF